MKALPILMSAPMVRALLEGRKSQTRRMLKPQPYGFLFGKPQAKLGGPDILCPYGNTGDVLWVRETCAFQWPEHCDDGRIYSDESPATLEWGRPIRRDECDVIYRATDDGGSVWMDEDGEPCDPLWTPSIFMPRFASRLTLEITDVRVERLQDISEADAIAEGVEPLFDKETAASRPEFDLNPMPYSNYLWHGKSGKGSVTQKQVDAWKHQLSSYKDARGSYSSLWESINGSGSWNANPWVWIVKFKTHHCNVDNLLKARAA
jgi:hypothetical protein